ncbi:Hypothetical predicted protein [Pelobates cultripes]|uniref:Uncharacterized protein n=1 Tax=Pelobates cultripes TaxID=61616 RepID=A0AAD1WJT8_PELCU|nr:Hypothetical predicted protein [Pelobates cultripes]
MSVAESETRALRTDLEHTNSTVTSQEADLASLTTWVDDLDNRGRRLNLRIRGVREGDPAEHIPDTLKRLFAQAGIPYRWGYPFSLSARHGQDQHTVKKPGDLPGFLRVMGIPPIHVQDWLASSFLQSPPGPQQPRRPDQGPPRLQQQRRRDWNPGPARREQEN